MWTKWTDMRVNRRELLWAVAVVAVAWLAFVFWLAKWQRGGPAWRPAGKPSAGGGGGEPELVHYPGTEGVQEQTSANLGFRKYWFVLNEDYPSRSVYYFYKERMGQSGWRLVSREDAQWFRRATGGKLYDLFYAMWVSPDRLFQLELEMKAQVKPIGEGREAVGEEHEPGIKVYVTLRRVLLPNLLVQPKQEERESGIEVR